MMMSDRKPKRTQTQIAQTIERRNTRVRGQRFLRGINKKIEIIIRLMENGAEPMKIFDVTFTKDAKNNGSRSWCELGPESISVAAPSAERAITAAKKDALKPISFVDDEEKKQTEMFKNFDLVAVKLLAESDING